MVCFLDFSHVCISNECIGQFTDPIIALGARYSLSVLLDHDENLLIHHIAAVHVNQFNWCNIHLENQMWLCELW